MKKKLSMVCLCLLLVLPLFSIAEDKESVSEAVIFGYTVKLGQHAGIVQSRIKADKFEFTYKKLGVKSALDSCTVKCYGL